MGARCALTAIMAALSLSACGNQAATPTVAPDTYYIGKSDLYRDPPVDICRAKNNAFLSGLIERVTGALPPDTTWADLEDFNAHSAFDGKGMEAVLRFRATIGGGPPVLMSVAGRFDPATCRVGALAGGVGANPHDPQTVATLQVPAA